MWMVIQYTLKEIIHRHSHYTKSQAIRPMTTAIRLGRKNLTQAYFSTSVLIAGLYLRIRRIP